MNITDEHLGNEIYKINLAGRMDIEGVSSIETTFASMTAAPRQAIIVDMSAVPYMSSIGIRALLINAKSLTKRQGKFVIFNPEANVRNVLVTSGIDQLIPIYDDLEQAKSAVMP
jgi:anti-anti-sigma factor